MDTRTDGILKEIEDKIKDRFTHYLIVVMDGDHVIPGYDSEIVAHGMANYIADLTRENWLNDE